MELLFASVANCNDSKNIWDKLLFLYEIITYYEKSSISVFQEYLLVLTKFLFQEEEWTLSNNSIKFWNFPNISQFPKILNVESFATGIYQFITNNHFLFYLWWKENLLNYQKVWKHYENDFLQNFILFSMFLLTAFIVENCHVSYSIFQRFDWYNSHSQGEDVGWKICITV